MIELVMCIYGVMLTLECSKKEIDDFEYWFQSSNSSSNSHIFEHQSQKTVVTRSAISYYQVIHK